MITVFFDIFSNEPELFSEKRGIGRVHYYAVLTRAIKEPFKSSSYQRSRLGQSVIL